MKQIYGLFIISLLLCTGMYRAQQNSSSPIVKKNHFYVSPGDLFFNTFHIGYERDLKGHNSVAFNGGFKLSESFNRIARQGGIGEIQYRVNLLYNKESVNVLNRNYSTFAYFAPFAQYRYEEINSDQVIPETGNKTTFIHSGFGGLGFGIRLTGAESRFSINAFAGGGMKYADIYGDQKYSDFFEVGYTGIAPKISFQMGIAF